MADSFHRLPSAAEDIYVIVPSRNRALLLQGEFCITLYDRFKSKASFRINIPIVLLALFWTATFLAQFPVAAKIVLLAVEFAVAILLLRQGLLRSISANDVIAQAIAIDQVQSQYIKSQKKTPEPTAAAAERKSPSGDDGNQESPEGQQDQQSPLRTEETGTAR
jgi:hypothetical protein